MLSTHLPVHADNQGGVVIYKKNGGTAVRPALPSINQYQIVIIHNFIGTES